MVEVPIETIAEVLGMIALGAFVWCWRLHHTITEIKTTQTIKTEDFASFVKAFGEMGTKVADIDTRLHEMSGYMHGIRDERKAAARTRTKPPA